MRLEVSPALNSCPEALLPAARYPEALPPEDSHLGAMYIHPGAILSTVAPVDRRQLRGPTDSRLNLFQYITAKHLAVRTCINSPRSNLHRRSPLCGDHSASK